MGNIELLTEHNKDIVFSNIPSVNENNMVYMKIKSLRGNCIWYVLENKGKALTCFIVGATTIKRDVYLWELWDSSCYIDKNFVPTTIDKLKL